MCFLFEMIFGCFGLGLSKQGQTLDRGPLVDTTNISSPVPLVGLPHLFVVRTLGPVVVSPDGPGEGGDGWLTSSKKRPKRTSNTLENEHLEPKRWRWMEDDFPFQLGDF